MSKRLLSAAGIVALVAASAFAQETQQPATTTTVTTKTTQAVQNPDGTWTVVEFPADKEVIVDLTPGATLKGATGRARVMRMKDHTMIHVDASGLADVTALNLYAVDPTGKLTLVGPLTVNNGTVAQNLTTPLDKFMLVLSPEANLTALADSTPVLFRSSVPRGFAVVPLVSRDHEGGAPVGEKVSAVSTPGRTSGYSVPMLNVPGMARGEDTDVKVNLTGAMTGSRVNVKLTPRKEGSTSITARFHELKEAPGGMVYVLWAVSPDQKFTKLGQIVNTGQRNEAEIKSETALADFGLLITTEQVDAATPAGEVVVTVMPL